MLVFTYFTDRLISLEPIVDVLNIMNMLLGIVLIVVYFTQNMYLVVGTFTKNKKYQEAKKYHTYGYVICAHNEEIVIGNLIDSIKKQNYPKDKIHIFVCCDNCTDRTSEISKQHGAIVIERSHDEENMGKCYTLDYAFKHILNNYDNLGIEAYFVFDADNLVTSDYTLKMNECFDSGILVCTSFRDSKNFDDNWISAGSSYTFYRENLLIHKSRSNLGIGTYISGTGFYVDANIIKKLNGWPFTTLIEDIEFSTYCCLNDIKIGYCGDAYFYDEQPQSLKDSWIQRMRWCRGTHQCFHRYGWKLFKKVIKNRSVYASEMLIHICPLPAISFMWSIFYLLIFAVLTLLYQQNFSFFFEYGVMKIVSLYLSVICIALVHGIITYILNYHRFHCSKFKAFMFSLLFPVYMGIFLPITTIALFSKVKWVKIEHKVNKKIENV